MELVYIGASWCSPCRTVKPLVTILAHKYSIDLTIKDYDEMDETEKESVQKLPTIRILEDGKVVKEITTAHADMLEMWLRTHVRVNATDDF